MSQQDPEQKDNKQYHKEPTLDTRFLWVLLGVMITMVVLPMLPPTARTVTGVLLAVWLAYEFWRFVFRSRVTR